MRSIICFIAAILALSIPGTASALSYSGYVYTEIDLYVNDTSYSFAGSDSQPLVFNGGYQPRDGLTAVSATSDNVHSSGAQAVASVALYGTDSSRSAVGTLDPELIASGLGVEPMVDVQLSSTSRRDTGQLWGESVPIEAVPLAQAQAHISVQHRVMLNPAITIPNNILGNVLDQLNTVPVEVQWAYSIAGTGANYAEFLLNIASPTGDCAGYVGGFCGGFFQSGSEISSASNSGSVPFTAVASTESRVALYDINLDAFASVRGSLVNASLQGVMDPYFTVAPGWEYAPYFMVQQESSLNEGEWVAITRDYLDGSAPDNGTSAVPEPATLLLLGLGSAGLVTAWKVRARRA